MPVAISSSPWIRSLSSTNTGDCAGSSASRSGSICMTECFKETRSRAFAVAVAWGGIHGLGLAAERQYQFIEGLKGSQVTRTGHGSDFEVKGLLAAAPHLVEVKTGNAVLSPLQRSTGPEVVRPNPFLNSVVAAGLGVAGGVASAAAITRLVMEHLEVTCGACGGKTTLDHRLCPNCGAPLPRGPEWWIGLEGPRPEEEES